MWLRLDEIYCKFSICRQPVSSNPMTKARWLTLQPAAIDGRRPITTPTLSIHHQVRQAYYYKILNTTSCCWWTFLLTISCDNFVKKKEKKEKKRKILLYCMSFIFLSFQRTLFFFFWYRSVSVSFHLLSWANLAHAHTRKQKKISSLLLGCILLFFV